MLPLCLGIDCGAHFAMGLVEPLAEPSPLGRHARLVKLYAAHGVSADEWAERAFEAAEVIATAARGRRVVGFAERVPPAGKAWMGAVRLAERRGQLLQALADAGMRIAGIDYALVSEWTGPLGIPVKKLGDGMHRLAEAERFVEMPGTTFRGLGDCVVDAAEAVLMAAAKARRVLGLPDIPREEKPRKPRAKRAGKGRTAA